jgi:dynein heavy chain
MSLWIRACVETFDALLIVDPKRQKLKEAEETLLESEMKLQEK